MNKKELEKNILEKTDKLVDSIINSSDDNDRSIKYKNAIINVKDLAKLTVKLIENEDHLENMLKQLISQKLPDKKILNSFGDFSKDIDYIIACGLKEYKQDTADKKLVNINYLNNVAPVKIYIKNNSFRKANKNTKKNEITSADLKALRLLFPTEKIISNYKVHGTIINYILPQKQLAVVISNKHQKKYQGLLSFWCKNNNIKLIKLLPEEIYNIKVLKKKLNTFYKC